MVEIILCLSECSSKPIRISEIIRDNKLGKLFVASVVKPPAVKLNLSLPDVVAKAVAVGKVTADFSPYYKPFPVGAGFCTQKILKGNKIKLTENKLFAAYTVSGAVTAENSCLKLKIKVCIAACPPGFYTSYFCCGKADNKPDTY